MSVISTYDIQNLFLQYKFKYYNLSPTLFTCITLLLRSLSTTISIPYLSLSFLLYQLLASLDFPLFT